MIRMLLNVSHRRFSPNTSNKKTYYIIKALVGLYSHSTVINFVSVYVSNSYDYIKVKMGVQPSLLDSC